MKSVLILLASFLISCKKEIQMKTNLPQQEKEKSVAEILSNLSKTNNNNYYYLILINLNF